MSQSIKTYYLSIELLLKANIFIELSRPNDALIILTKLYGELLS